MLGGIPGVPLCASHVGVWSARLLESIVVSVENRCDRRRLFGEHAQVQLGVALLDHAAQKAGCIYLSGWFVDGTSVPADPFLMTGGTLVLGDQPFTQLVV